MPPVRSTMKSKTAGEQPENAKKPTPRKAGGKTTPKKKEKSEKAGRSGESSSDALAAELSALREELAASKARHDYEIEAKVSEIAVMQQRLNDAEQQLAAEKAASASAAAAAAKALAGAEMGDGNDSARAAGIPMLSSEASEAPATAEAAADGNETGEAERVSLELAKMRTQLELVRQEERQQRSQLEVLMRTQAEDLLADLQAARAWVHPATHLRRTQTHPAGVVAAAATESSSQPLKRAQTSVQPLTASVTEAITSQATDTEVTAEIS